MDENEYSKSNSLKRFLVPLESFNLAGGETKVVEATINVPSNAEAGGYFGAIRFAPTAPDAGGQVNMSPSVASIILLRVNGQVSEKLELTDFQVLQDSKATNYLLSDQNVSMLVRFKNDSKVQLAPFGSISVQKGDKVVYNANFNNSEQKDMVLPASARRWEVPLKDIDGFGKYTVSATFTYGSANQTLEATQVFWVIPLPIIIGSVIGLVVVIGLIVLLIVRSKRQKGSVKLGK